MYHSGEIRWFFAGEAPADARRWFGTGGLGTDEPERTDEYLVLPRCATTSVKVRAGRFEVKALTASPEPVSYPNGVSGLRDAWVKWSSNTFDAQSLRELTAKNGDEWLLVHKSRRLRVFSLDGATLEEVRAPGPWLGQGCQVELTSIGVRSPQRGGTAMAPWWSLSFEAFGDPARPFENLDRVANHVFAAAPPNRLDQDASCSYPVWLGQFG